MTKTQLELLYLEPDELDSFEAAGRRSYRDLVGMGRAELLAERAKLRLRLL